MSATVEPAGMRRRNYQNMVDRMHRQFLAWRTTMPDYRMKVPNSTETTPRMGDMDYLTSLRWAHRVSAADAEASINKSNEAMGRAKLRAGEAA